MFYHAIPNGVESLLLKLGGIELPQETYLAGGTAAALYLGHRESIDIDLFTPTPFDTLEIVARLKPLFSYTPLNERPETLLCELDSVKFSLFFYRYPSIEQAIRDKRYAIPIASPLDIALMKMIAIYQRGTAKDFIDLQYLMKSNGYTLPSLENRLIDKYGFDRNLFYHIRRSLVYFDDAERTKSLVVMLDNGKRRELAENDWEQTKHFYRSLVVVS